MDFKVGSSYCKMLRNIEFNNSRGQRDGFEEFSKSVDCGQKGLFMLIMFVVMGELGLLGVIVDLKDS